VVDAALSGVDGSPSSAQRYSIEAFSLDWHCPRGCMAGLPAALSGVDGSSPSALLRSGHPGAPLSDRYVHEH